MRTTIAALALIVTLLCGISLAEKPATGPLYFPASDTWETVSCQQAGVDAKQLQAALDYAGEHNSGGVVVLWRGRILAEQYWDGWTDETTHPLYSASKSVTSSLVGMAIADGKIRDTNQSACDFITEWKGDGKTEAITVGHLLSMSSGLEGGRQNFLKGILSRDERGFATGLPVTHEPGTYWEYHNSAYRLILYLLEEATKESLQAYTKRKLLDPIGMTRTKWETKWLTEDQYTFLSTTPRDAARYGLLVLAHGNWNGKQLVAKEWIDRATKPANPKANPAYGYLWWLNGGEYYYRPLNPWKQQGPIFPGCPADAFAALGKDDQKIYIVPSLDLVVTRLGDAADSTTPALSKFDSTFLGKICGSFGKE